jgi:hypothetical protein
MTDLNLANISQTQLELLISTANNPRDGAFIGLLLRTSARISEAI